MASRYQRQLSYAIGLFSVGTIALVLSTGSTTALPEPSVWIIGTAAFLVVWHFGMPVPHIGLISLERVPQFALLLTFGPVAASAINATAALIWPFTSASYSQGSVKVAAMRAVHNAGMEILLMLIGGWCYLSLGGSVPLERVTWWDAVALLVSAVVIQGLNNALMVIFYWLDERDAGRLFTPLYALGDLLFVPAGVLAALLLFNGPGPAIWLLGLLLVTILVSFNHVLRAGAFATDELSALTAVARRLRSSRRMNDVAHNVYAQCRALFRFDDFYLVLVNPEGSMLDFLVHVRDGRRLPRKTKPVDRGLFGHAIETGEAILVPDWREAPADLLKRAEHAGDPSGSFIVVPLSVDRAPIGVVSIQTRNPRAYSEADLNLLKRLAEQFSGAIADARAFEELDRHRASLEELVAERTRNLEAANKEKQRLLEQLEEKSEDLERQSKQDPLTGLANRRDMDLRLEFEIERARTLNYPLTVAIADLDRFKQVNDEFGHAVGDNVLQIAAELLSRHCRASDVVARYGGEEFVILLPGCDAAAAHRIAESIRVAFKNHGWQALGEGVAVTVSIGIAEWAPGLGPKEVLAVADERLYRAKRNGRNRVESSE